MLVADVMTTDVVTCDFDAPLQTAVVRMVKNRVGSVIVLRDGDPMGIVTETDALYAGAATEQPFVDIPLSDVVSHPLVTTTANVSVRKAVNRMKEKGIKKLAVVDGMDVEGILTRSDIVSHYDDFVTEARRLDRQRGRWDSRKSEIDEY